MEMQSVDETFDWFSNTVSAQITCKFIMLKKGGPYFSPMGKFGSFSPKEVFILFFPTFLAKRSATKEQ